MDLALEPSPGIVKPPVAVEVRAVTAPGGSGIFGLAHVAELAVVLRALFVVARRGVFYAGVPSAAEFHVVFAPLANFDAVLIRTNSS
jgi:hypothetical protein